MTVTYEWVLEELNSEDIIDAHFDTTLADVLNLAPKDGTPWQAALVRSVHHPVDEELIDRAYAYLVDGKLPDTFDNGVRVPMKFKRQGG